MSGPSAPLPPREAGRMPRPAGMRMQEQRARLLMTIVFFIVGLSVVLSFNWGGNPPGFRPDAALTILFAILVAAIIYIAARYSSRHMGRCPACGRAIPADALLCPYCGKPLS